MLEKNYSFQVLSRQIIKNAQINVSSIKLIINATYHPVIALKYVRIQHETTSTNVVQSPCKDFGNDCKNTRKKIGEI